ncbi:3-dehydroquinate synthase [Ectothiorhodospiraceae bacterium WFHF3C12]|nr:3-dehydroquinate synthase [Ectothiorhodospiraceae bacterium WFHF3C12]
MRTVQVDLQDRSYPIYIGTGLLDQPELLRRHIPGNSALVVTNETVAPIYGTRLAAALDGLRTETVAIPDGEQFKNLETANLVYDALLANRMDRQTTIIALGGGVVGDLAGFVAATYQRGVHFIQVPTTLLALVDSSVGGKTAVNHPRGKNMIGAFHQPRCVLADVRTLESLPDREYRAGIAEVIKYGLIMDYGFLQWLERNMSALLAREPDAMVHAVEQSCMNKARVVAADERETGQRALLNLGHTFGHAIETATGYSEWLHGEAVAAGMCMAAHMSRELGWISDSALRRARALIAEAGLPVEPPAMTAEQFMALMSVDKKVEHGRIRLVLLQGLGNATVTADFPVEALETTLTAFTHQAA